MVPTSPSKALALRSEWIPPAVPSPEAANRLLHYLMWHSAQDIACSLAAEGTALPTRTSSQWPLAVAALFEDEDDLAEMNRRREMLYSLTVQRLNALEHLNQGALVRALKAVHDEGLYHLDGWRGVTGWALAIRDGYSQSTGFWWTLGQLIDFVLPFVERFLPAFDQRKFLDTSYLYRIGVVTPQMVRIIKLDDGLGGRDAVDRIEALLAEAESSSKQDLMDRHQAHRRDKAPAWSEPTRDGVWLHVLVEDDEHAEVVLRRLGALVDFRGAVVEGETA